MDVVGIVALVCSTALSLLLVPDLRLADLAAPPVQAAVVTPLVLSALVAVRVAGAPAAWERRLLALFLAAMPTVYLLALARHGVGAGWLAGELAGQLAYGLLALVGLYADPWALVVGIAAHGLGWDLWHLGRAPFMPDWYARACLVIDVGWALYAATRVPAWRDDVVHRRTPAAARTTVQRASA
jgi:hypothetical protein